MPLVDSIGDLLQLVFRNFHKITGTHFEEFAYELSSHSIMLFCLKGTFHKKHFPSVAFLNFHCHLVNVKRYLF